MLASLLHRRSRRALRAGAGRAARSRHRRAHGAADRGRARRVDGRAEVVRSSADGAFVAPRTRAARLRGARARLRLRRVRSRGQRRQRTRDDVRRRARAAAGRTARGRRPRGARFTGDERDHLRSRADRSVGPARSRRAAAVERPASSSRRPAVPARRAHVSIRGSSASEVLVLVDGVPINSQITGDADLSRVSLETVERVVVRTGAQSARYGGRALAGVIEIETRRAGARDVDARPRRRVGRAADASARSASGESVRRSERRGSLTGDYRTVRGDFPYDVPALRGGGTAHRINSDVTSRQLLGGLTVEGDSMAIRARGSWSDLSRGLAGSIVQPSSTGRQTNTRGSAGVDARREHRHCRGRRPATSRASDRRSSTPLRRSARRSTTR